MLNQLANDPQALAQLVQIMQHNNMAQNQPPQRPPMNWNVPTNPMAAMWWNNMMNAMNNANNQNNNQVNQNNNQVQQQNNQPEQKSDGKVLPIRVVKSPEDIKLYQIPMDNDITLFLQEDLSVIYGKRWTNDADMENIRFVRVDDNDNSNPANEVKNQDFNTEELMSAIANLVDDKLEQFKKENSLDIRSQSKSRTNRKVDEVNGK